VANQVTPYALNPLLSTSLCSTQVLSSPCPILLCDSISNTTTFSAIFIKLIDHHLPKYTTLQAPHLHTVKKCPFRSCSLLTKSSSTSLSSPLRSSKMCILTSLSTTLYSLGFKICPLPRHSCRQFLCTGFTTIMLFFLSLSQETSPTSFPFMTHYCHKARTRKITLTTLRKCCLITERIINIRFRLDRASLAFNFMVVTSPKTWIIGCRYGEKVVPLNSSVADTMDKDYDKNMMLIQWLCINERSSFSLASVDNE